MSTVITNSNNYVSIANAIRNKLNVITTFKPSEMPLAIQNIPSGGGDDTKDINFYDNDGNIIESYNLSDLPLSALPTAPTVAGLTFEEYNYTLEQVNALTDKANIGATYKPTDGKTHIWYTLTKVTGQKPTLTLSNPSLSTITVSWGDGQTSTGSGGTFTPTNDIAYGDYELTIESTGIYNLPSLSSQTCIFGSYIYNNCITKIWLSEQVSSVGDYAFNSCYSLTNITLPGGLSSIGGNAFANCCSLTNITLPGGLSSVGNYAFAACYSLTNITLPGGLSSIGGNAFTACYSLTNITLPGGLSSIGGNAFTNCYSLTNITLPGGLSSIGGNAFTACYSLTNITLPGGLSSIGNYAFTNCRSLTNITLPGGLSSVGDYAFNSCHSLTNITLPGGLSSIGGNAFNSCHSLTNITLPGGLSSIGGNAFANCFSIIEYDFTECTSVPTLASTNAFTSINPICKIKVTNSLYNEWIAATNWATYADYIVGVDV